MLTVCMEVATKMKVRQPLAYFPTVDLDEHHQDLIR